MTIDVQKFGSLAGVTGKKAPKLNDKGRGRNDLWSAREINERIQRGSTADHTHSEFPSSSTDNAVVRFNGTSGAMQNSGVTIDDSNNVTGVVNLTVSGDILGLSRAKFYFYGNMH